MQSVRNPRLRNSAPPLALVFALVMSWTTPVPAVETKVLRDDSFSQFNQGESTGTEVLSQGRLRIGLRAEKLDKTDEGVAWRIVIDPYDGSVFYSTGHNGKIFRHKPGNKPELWADLPEVEAISMAIDPNGGLLVGASPGGKIYRIVQPNKPQLFFETKEQYVWDMIFDRNGALYAGTGPNGKIFRVRGERNGELFYDSSATNVMALTFERDGTLLAATQGKAFVIRVQDANNAFVLYTSQEDEIRALTADQTGNIYAALNSARTSSVFDSSAKEDRPSPAMNLAMPTPTPTPRPDEGEKFGTTLGGQSGIIQIQPSGFATAFWPSPEGPIHAMLADSETSSLLVAAGKRGKLYRVSVPDANYAVAADLEEPMILALAQLKGRKFMATANKAALYELQTTATARESFFASRIFNAGTTVHWGNLFYEAEVTSDSDIQIETRTGNTPDPTDGTWSSWTKGKKLSAHIMQSFSPVAQYFQYKITLRSSGESDGPTFDGLQAFYVETNATPILRDINVTKVAAGFGYSASRGRPSASPVPTPSSGTPSQLSAYSSGSRSDADPGQQSQGRSTPGFAEPASSTGIGSVTQNTQTFSANWTAMDPNGDDLHYHVYLKAEDETEWKQVGKNLTSPRFMFGTEAVPDGHYRMKVEATDEAENQETSASTSSIVSHVWVADNSAPDVLSITGSAMGKDQYEIVASVKDDLSIIAAAEYNLDAGKEWRAVSPTDGIFDFTEETFRLRVKPDEENKDLKEHVFVLRVYDREGNSKSAKLILRP